MLDDLQCVLQGYGVENSFKVMKAVGSFAQNMKSKVDLTIGEEDQGRLGFGVRRLWFDNQTLRSTLLVPVEKGCYLYINNYR